ncbi:MAG: L-serine ammonia-lyase, iron-sulfur-dependent, subunit alpha [Prevotella sp.]|nr:L-serine ammonia-lyase, iron-sulfur-dependent, subunit alpha [Prevotella sp.]
MLSKEERAKIIALINQEVVPAVGCTEPMAVALCVAKATELLGMRPESITISLSANILKNAMGVGIPGTDMIGLPIAIGLGVIVGKSEYGLAVIKDVTPSALCEAKRYIKAVPVDIKMKEGITEKLYIEADVAAEGHSVKAVIAGSHTNFIYLRRDDKVIKNEPLKKEEEGACGVCLNFRMVYDFAMTAPLDEISFILKTKEYNLGAAKESLKGNYGHCLGKTIDRPLAHGIFGNSIFSQIISKTALACDARMGGALVPVMCNSGSGNQGICATNPVAVFAIENENTDEEMIRALVLSHLTAIYIKQSLGKLSALCGCVVASIGSSCGITYLMGGDYKRICFSVQNMIANLTGMICDGAKPSCSLKITSGVSTALLSALLSMEGRHVTSVEGIIDEDVDRSIHNLTSIGAESMCQTDNMVLDIMTHKGHR